MLSCGADSAEGGVLLILFWYLIFAGEAYLCAFLLCNNLIPFISRVSRLSGFHVPGVYASIAVD